MGDIIFAMGHAGANVYRGTKYISEEFVVKVTRRHKPDGRDNILEYVITAGRPNYVEREFIKKLRLAQEPFPVKNIQLKLYPTLK